jgi:hypothetical protein
MEIIENVKKSILVFICSVVLAHSMHTNNSLDFLMKTSLQCEVDIYSIVVNPVPSYVM